MRRLLEAGFLLGGGLLSVGLVLVFGSAIVAGDWWQARMPWIGHGLDATVVGLGLVHITAPVLVFVVLARSSARGLAVIGLLVAGLAVSIGLALLRAATVELLLVTFAAWALIAILVTAWRRDARSWLVSTLAVPVTGLSAVVVGIWWLIAAQRPWSGRVPGAPPPPPDLIGDTGTMLYSSPHLAFIVPGLPTAVLLVLALLAMVLPRLTRDRSPATVSAGQPVLT